MPIDPYNLSGAPGITNVSGPGLAGVSLPYEQDMNSIIAAYRRASKLKAQQSAFPTQGVVRGGNSGGGTAGPPPIRGLSQARDQGSDMVPVTVWRSVAMGGPNRTGGNMGTYYGLQRGPNDVPAGTVMVPRDQAAQYQLSMPQGGLIEQPGPSAAGLGRVETATPGSNEPWINPGALANQAAVDAYNATYYPQSNRG